MKSKIKCYICGTEYLGQELMDSCPVCDWITLGCEDEMDENDEEDINGVSIAEAKRNFAKGLDIWGDPLNENE